MYTRTLELKVGDKIAIALDNWTTIYGTITRRPDHYEKYGWYIQFVQPNGTPGYWKEGIDGGTVKKLS